MAEENPIPMGKWGPTDAWIKETNAKWFAARAIQRKAFEPTVAFCKWSCLPKITGITK